MKKLRVILAVFIVLMLFGGIWSLYDYQASLTAFTQATLATTQEQMREAAGNVEQLMAKLNRIATELAEELAQDAVLRADPNERLKKLLADEPAIFGIGLISATELKDQEFRLKSSSYQTRWEREQLASIDVLPLCRETVVATDENGEKSVVGTVIIDISRQFLQNYLYSLHIGKHGYAFIIASGGVFICHPSEACLESGKTIYDHAKEEKVASLADMGRSAEAGLPGCFDLHSESSGNPMWGVLTPIKYQGWALAKVLLKEPVQQPTASQQRQRYFAITLIIIAASLLLLLAGLATSKDVGIRWWVGSSLFSVGLAVGIVSLWFINLSSSQYSLRGEVPIADDAVLDQYLDNLGYRMVLGGYSKPERIPTGVFVQSVDFQSAVNLKVSGYVWQKFNTDSDREFSEGVIFPDAQEFDMEKAYERTVGNVRTVGWWFRLDLREGFDYLTYPFDLESVWLRMWPKDFDKNIVLVPDFDSYRLMTPEFLPGIDTQLILPGWQLLQSNFSYLPTSYNTNFGIARYAGLDDFPELHFNLIIRREFMDPFISSLLPLIVVMILLFIMQLTCSREENLKDLFGFSAGAILAGVAALFFVVIFAHIDLRKNLEVERIMYMDFYYFVIYFVFMLVSMNAVLFCWTREIALIHYRDNLIPKLLYWPFILGVIFLTTAVYFCP